MKQKAKVEIYTWDHCPYCRKAVALLDGKNVEYERYRIDGDEAAREKMAKRANGRKTVPQIFIDNNHVGGCDDICALDENERLEGLIFEK